MGLKLKDPPETTLPRIGVLTPENGALLSEMLKPTREHHLQIAATCAWPSIFSKGTGNIHCIKGCSECEARELLKFPFSGCLTTQMTYSHIGVQKCYPLMSSELWYSRDHGQLIWGVGMRFVFRLAETSIHRNPRSSCTRSHWFIRCEADLGNFGIDF